MRVVAAAILVSCVAACDAGPPGRAWRSEPRLVVLVVIDQFPDWAFSEKLPYLHGGFARAIATGRRYLGEHPSAVTSTAPGHALLGTGAPPREHGIIANDWWRPALGREVAAMDDGTGAWTTAALRVPGLADALAAARPNSRAVAIALKARAALLPLGQKSGLALWYDATRPGWKVNVEPRPAWVDKLEADHPVAPRLAYEWQPLDPAALARETGHGDDMPGELGTHQLGATFPHRLADTDDAARSVQVTPLGCDLELEAALAALDGAGLGTDDEPDYLSISFSAHDYITHAWGQESWEAWDVVHRLDAQLAVLFDALDAKVGRGRWSMILTADHGGAPLPERSGGSRHPYGDVEAIAEEAATTIAGAGDWIATVHYPSLHLSEAARALPAATRDAVLDAIVVALGKVPWLQRAVRKDRLPAGCAGATGDDLRLCLALDAERSGDVAFAPARFVILHENDEVTASHHNSTQPYDYQVPLILVGRGIPSGTVAEPVSMLRVTPTLAKWLGVPPPSHATAPALP